MVFYLPTALIVLQTVIAIMSWSKPSKVSQTVLAGLSAVGCMYLTGFVLQTPWVFTWQVVLWLALGGVQLSFVLFALLGGNKLWKVSTIVQPLLFPFMLLATLGSYQADLKGTLVEGTWLQAHIVSAIIANGILAMAGVFAFAVITRQAYLKARATSSFVEKLPPLDVLEKAQTAGLYLGAAILAVAVIAGAVTTHHAYGQWFIVAWKNLSAVIMLAMVVTLIIGKRVCGVRGRHGAQVVMAIYFLFLLTILFTTIINF